jgi:hypothetical protein
MVHCPSRISSSTCSLFCAASKDRGSCGVPIRLSIHANAPATFTRRGDPQATSQADRVDVIVQPVRPFLDATVLTLSDSHLVRLSHATAAWSCNNPLQTGLRPLHSHLDRRILELLRAPNSCRAPSSLSRALAMRFLVSWTLPGASGVSSVLHYLG